MGMGDTQCPGSKGPQLQDQMLPDSKLHFLVLGRALQNDIITVFSFFTLCAYNRFASSQARVTFTKSSFYRFDLLSLEIESIWDSSDPLVPFSGNN